MSPVALLELVLLLLAAAILLSLLAGRFAVPPAAALVIGGMALALVPGTPNVEIDPDLIMVLFLPPLLLASAYFTVWRDFRAEWSPILSLSIGLVIFTTLGVGVVTHALMPSLPWAACFTLGAIVSPPDAVAAKAVLQRVPLPHRLLTILEGESLVNDASGLVLYRFAVAAALTGSFSWSEAAGSFAWLAIAGVAIGLATGLLADALFRRLADVHFIIVTSFLAAYGSYFIAERLHGSGVLAAVSCGILMGWRQHETLDAAARTEAKTVWGLVVFVMEALVFVLIGLSLRGVLTRMGGADTLTEGLPIAGIVTLTAIVLRLVWVYPAAYLPRLLSKSLRQRDPIPSPAFPLVIGWAGMRGVVSLAAALALPQEFPGRDLILLVSFIVILVTVLFQGTTLGPLIRRLRLKHDAHAHQGSMSEAATRAAVAEASLKALEAMIVEDTGELLHPRLVQEYQARARALARARDEGDSIAAQRQEHFKAALHAVEHGRQTLIRLHRTGKIHDSVLHSIETDLDLEELRLRRLAAPIIGQVTRVAVARQRSAELIHVATVPVAAVQAVPAAIAPRTPE